PLPPEIFTRRPLTAGHEAAVLPLAVHALDEMRHPARAHLQAEQLEAREAFQGPALEEADKRALDVEPQRDRQIIECGALECRMIVPLTAAVIGAGDDMQADRQAVVL